MNKRMFNGMKNEILKVGLLVSTFGLIFSGCGEGQNKFSPLEHRPNAYSMGKPLTGFTKAREEMVRTQIEVRGIKDKRVLKVITQVPRHEFVLPSYQRMAYSDRPLPIGYDQTISQPYIVALMTESLKLKGDEKVLEIGTGSGYQAAILAELTQEVYTIEIISALTRRAEKTLEKLGYRNIKVKSGDGYLGWPEYAPFDAIIVTCAPDHIPQPLIDQLAEGGRMVIPVADTYPQRLTLIRKKKGKIIQEVITGVMFVPMTGKEIQKHK